MPSRGGVSWSDVEGCDFSTKIATFRANLPLEGERSRKDTPPREGLRGELDYSYGDVVLIREGDHLFAVYEEGFACFEGERSAAGFDEHF